ncbi:GAF domain-containing protein [Spirillospora sp. NPDC048911]|uniref:GAF domain-containing protein n=1 Tax=Spirillospora sp. NPDC048911 TaxID=3364527 RepID=UPI00371CC9AF
MTAAGSTPERAQVVQKMWNDEVAGDEVAPVKWAPAGRTWSSGDPERLAASFELMSVILDGAGLTDVLGRVATNARAMARARLAFIALPQDDPNLLRVEIAVGDDGDRVLGLTVRRGRSMIGRVFATRRALSARVAVDQALTGLPAGPILLLPLETGEATRGVLAVVGRPGDLPLSASVTRNLALFAGMAATLIELAEERRAADRTAEMR